MFPDTVHSPGQDCDGRDQGRLGDPVGTTLASKLDNRLSSALWRHTQWVRRQQSHLAHILISPPCATASAVHSLGEDFWLCPAVSSHTVMHKCGPCAALSIPQPV